jgi:hypothetical protein
VAAWLAPEGRSSAELMALLDDRAPPGFQHVHLRAA